MLTRPPFTYDGTILESRLAAIQEQLTEIQTMLQRDASKGPEFTDKVLRADGVRYSRAAAEVSKAVNNLYAAIGHIGLIESRGQIQLPPPIGRITDQPIPVHTIGE